jgi:hypothetical protein
MANNPALHLPRDTAWSARYHSINNQIHRFAGVSMKTLFLQAPSSDGFDGGAGSRYQAKREVRSF